MSEMTKAKEKILVYEPVAEAPGASAVMGRAAREPKRQERGPHQQHQGFHG